MFSHLFPPAIYDLMNTLRALQGIGTRSAQKLAFSMLDWQETELEEFCRALQRSRARIETCQSCGCLFDKEAKCWSCLNKPSPLLCIVSNAKEAFSIQSTGTFKGCFHVLGGVLDPLKGVKPENLRLESLLERLLNESFEEVLVAIDSTLEGDATSLYIKQMIDKEITPTKPYLKISRLGFGMPMNSSLELADSATLARAISSKNYW